MAAMSLVEHCYNMHMEYAEELTFARELAAQAGKIIKGAFNNRHVVTMKADDSPVTAVDREINDLVSNSIRQKFPADAFDGEEGSSGEMSAHRVWVCDPVDGTVPFLLGMPACMFMLGLFVDGEAQLAVAFNPLADELYEAVRGGGAHKNGQPIHIGDYSGEDHAIIVVDSKAYRESPKVIDALETLGYQVAGANGTGVKVMKVAEGIAAGMFREVGDHHDIGVGALIAEEAGAKVGSLHGDRLLDDRLQLHDGFIIAGQKVFADIQAAVQRA